MKKLFSGFVLVVFGLLMVPTVSHAEGAGFTMEPVLPENQQNDNTYFDLNVRPDTQQTLTINLQNLQSEPLTVKVSPNAAFTNQNGAIDYSDAAAEKDDAATYALPELVSEAQTVELAANQTKAVNFTLTIPKQTFSGMILGGFYATPVTEEKTNDKETISLQNKYAMVVGVSLREDLSTVTPNLKMNQIFPGLDNGYTAIFANLQNTEPQAFGKMTVTAKVYKKGSDEVFKETKKENQEMAPNSNYDFGIDWKNDPLEAGEYHLNLVAASGSKTWKFDRDFTISAKDAEKLNKKAVKVNKPNYLWLYILIGILLILLLLYLAYLLGKRKKKEEPEENDESEK